jgi:hypothetical protein
MKYVRKLDRVLLPLDKYIFQLAKQHLIFSITQFQIDLALKEGPNGRSRYFKGKEESPQPKILARPSKSLTLPIGTSSDLAKIFFKLDTTSKHKNKALRLRLRWWFAFAPQNIKVSSTNRRWEMLNAPMFLYLTKKPERKPPFIVGYSILLRASMPMTNSKGEKISLS